MSEAFNKCIRAALAAKARENAQRYYWERKRSAGSAKIKVKSDKAPA